MNFHKTIGFLATLLLTLGLGVPDSFAQTVSGVVLKVDPASIDEGDPVAPILVTVTVTLDADPGMDVTRNVVVNLAQGSNLVGKFTPPLPITIPVTVRAGGTSGANSASVVYTPPSEDDHTVDQTFNLVASVGSVMSDPPFTVTINNSGGTNFSSVTLRLNGEKNISVAEGSAASDVTVSVNAVLSQDKTAGYTRDVVVDLASGSTLLGTFSPALPITVTATVAAGELDAAVGQRVVTYTAPDADANTDNEMFTLEASVVGDDATGSVPVTVVDINIVSSTIVLLNNTNALTVSEGDGLIGVAVAVTVSLDNDSQNGEMQDVVVDLVAGQTLQGTFSPALPITVTATTTGNSATGSLAVTYTPDNDGNAADETFTLEASTAGDNAATTKTPATVSVMDDDTVSKIVIELDPDTVKDSAKQTDITVSVTVTFADAADRTAALAVPDSVVVTGSGSGSFADLGKVGLTAATGADDTTATGSITVKYTPPGDVDSEDSTAEVTGTLANQTGMATLKVDDDDVPVGKIDISVNPTEIREDVRARDVTVTATLKPTSTEAVTVNISTMVVGSEDMSTATPSGTIVIAAGMSSGSIVLSINPTDDDVRTTRTIKVTGSAPASGYTSGSADITVLDDDASLGTLSITAAPPSVTLTGGDQQVTLTVTGTMVDKEASTGTVVVTVMTDKGMFPNGTKSQAVTVSMKDNVDEVPDTVAPTGTQNIVLSLDAADVATASTLITVTASAEMYDSGTRVIPVIDRDALDIAGYRVVIANKSDGQWLNIGNNKVNVEVTRVGSVAYPWTDFESIKVSLRDTAHAEYEIDYVTAAGFNNEDGTITFREVFKPHSTRGDGIVNNEGNIVYLSGDKIRFQVGVNARGHDRPVETEPDNGQYLGVYAHVEFKSGTLTKAITNRQSGDPVYPSNPTLIDEANRYVGDGKLVKVDNLVPSRDPITDVKVTSGSGDAEEVGGNINATVGDEIRVAVKVSGDVLFRESQLRIQIQPWDNDAAQAKFMGRTLKAAQVATVTKTKTFTAAQVIASTSDSLRHTWNITEGFFTMKTADFVEGIGATGTVFQPDDTQARVLVAIGDQAGNWSGVNESSGTETRFGADSRSPGVTIRYPSADPDSLYDHLHPLRFSGHASDDVYGYSEFLNPLIVEVDEALLSLKVFAVGADTLDISDQFSSNSVGDSTVAYETFDLNSPKKDDDGNWIPSSDNVGGTEIELAVLATDRLGNTTKTTIANVTHDAARPVITEWFPKTSLIEDNQINDATPPTFTLPEGVDSIAVTFAGSNGSDVTKGRGGVTTKGDDSIDFSGALTQDVSYEMTIFARDLAGNVFITPADSSSNMKFNAQFDNPTANRFSISTETDSVIAGQANILTIQAIDHDAASDTNRNALTYRNAVRISAWENGTVDESVWFEGTGVDDDADNPDGMAMLNAADWRIGKRTVAVKSNKANGLINVLLQHLDSGMGDTAVVGFDSAIDSLYVGAADFNRFEITAWEDGADGPVDDIWGDYTLRVVPVDRHGNPSVRAFKADFDSLDVLDTRAGDNAFEYKNGIDVEIVGVPTIEDFALLILPIEKAGASYDLVAPDDRRTQTVQVRVVNTSLMEGDSRSQNIRSSVKFTIAAPLTPMLTLWVPGSDKDEAGNDVSIPADPGTVTVTVAAEGYNAGDMVTFTQDGMAMDPVTADDDGVAKLMITASEVGTVMVSATDGRYSTDELTITFVDTPPAKPMRKKYVDVKGAPVYLIYSGDAPPDMMVDVADFLVLVSTFGSSDGDDHYNVQADVDDDGDVDVSDFLEFITSWGKTAVGPATKPLVLLPGINENAEFSLSLGSERVVAGELVAVDVSLANVQALVGYGFALNYETDKFEFISVAPADEDLLKSTGGETLFHHVVADGQVTVANGLYNGTAVSGGGDAVRFVFRVLREFEDNARFEIADGLVFDPGQLRNSAVVAGVLELQSTPSEFALHQNFPNPFNPDTTIKYDLAESADVTLQIYNVLGQVIRTLVASEVQNAGRYQIRWNGMDDRGVPVSSGIYFYQISADGKFSDVRKLMLLK